LWFAVNRDPLIGTVDEERVILMEDAAIKPLPDKLFYRINEVSMITGIKPYVLRYWETEFKELQPQKDQSDQRRYRKNDIELVLQIKKLLYEERFTIAGAKKRIKEMYRQSRSEAQSAGGATRKRSGELKTIGKKLHAVQKDIHQLINSLGR
jgi:DNA-binding transcriptional MerR regulator